MHRYDRIWTAWVNGHLTKLESTDLCLLYIRLAEVEYGVRWERFKRRLGIEDLIA
jgi:hypothetical protein